jgi:hypothetical protein
MIPDISNISIKENFLEKKDTESILNFAKTKAYWNSVAQDGDYDKSESNIYDKDSYVHHIIMKYLDVTKTLIELKYGRKLNPGYAALRKWAAGDFQPLHADGEDLEGNPNHAYAVDYASVIYLNDDYEGGEIYFPDLDFSIKPKAGTLIFFPSNQYYSHGVREITSGEIYTIPNFWIPEKHIRLMEFVKNNVNN